MAGIRDIWRIYAHWDPLFLTPPDWLKVLCTIEVFIFGPLYVMIAIGLQSNATWLKPIGYCFSGALVYSTIVYFTMEILESAQGTNFSLVFLVNCPWTFVPLLLIYHLITQPLQVKNE
jgi:hypothetical protein